MTTHDRLGAVTSSRAVADILHCTQVEEPAGLERALAFRSGTWSRNAGPHVGIATRRPVVRAHLWARNYELSHSRNAEQQAWLTTGSWLGTSHCTVRRVRAAGGSLTSRSALTGGCAPCVPVRVCVGHAFVAGCLRGWVPDARFFFAAAAAAVAEQC